MLSHDPSAVPSPQAAAPLGTAPALAGAGWVVGADIGGTFTKAVVVGPDGRISGRLRTPTQPGDGPAAVLARTAALVRQARQLPGTDGPVVGVGVGVPGLVDEQAGTVEFSANLGWRNMAAASMLSEMCQLPVALGHDVRLGGQAEGRLGAARGASDYMFVALGTGIAASLTLDGKQRRGPKGLGGELGHVIAMPAGPGCNCGGRGCLEELASASGIGRAYRSHTPGPPIGSAEVLELARQGDPAARRVWARALELLGQALAWAHACVELELVVVGGGMAKAGTELFGPLEASVRSHLPCTPAPRLALAQLGDEAASLGAALLARVEAGASLAPGDHPTETGPPAVQALRR
jgi:glucokinase